LAGVGQAVEGNSAVGLFHVEQYWQKRFRRQAFWFLSILSGYCPSAVFHVEQAAISPE
jgi:hypothetical protein